MAPSTHGYVSYNSLQNASRTPPDPYGVSHNPYTGGSTPYNSRYRQYNDYDPQSPSPSPALSIEYRPPNVDTPPPPAPPPATSPLAFPSPSPSSSSPSSSPLSSSSATSTTNATTATASTANAATTTSNATTPLVAGVAGGVATVALALAILLIIYVGCRRRRKQSAHETHNLNSDTIMKPRFTYQELETATGKFAMSNKLGEGGFGCVYKGTLASSSGSGVRQLVAVKQLNAGGSQGEKEFEAEVETISRVHHRHLVSLVGYCISKHERLLVYEYVPNGTLDYHLHKRTCEPPLDWPTRLKIACGVARGLAYLHEDCHPRIIHRDIKSSNILLDDKFEARVSDFGLAKATCDTNTHVTTRVMGTLGYLAPEYASSGKLTQKSDVFSFGVVLLELVTGRNPIDASQPLGQDNLVEWARPIFSQINREEHLDIVADPTLNGVYDPKEMLRMIEVASACISHLARMRPRMGQVVTTLESEISLSDLNKESRYSNQSLKDCNHGDDINHNIEAMRLKMLALPTKELENDSMVTSVEHKVKLSHNMMSSDEMMTSTRPTPTTTSTSSFASPRKHEGIRLDNEALLLDVV